MTSIEQTVLPVAEAGIDLRVSKSVVGEVLELRGIVKTFPGVRALTDVNLTVRAGEVHALVGENGAGKSTLMAVASGALAPNAGAVEIGGTVLAEADPEAARELGLGIVRQDPALLPDLTVAENMAIGAGFRRAGGLRNAPKWAQRQLDPWQMGIDARSRVSELSVEQRFVVEIAKALVLDPKVLILDEPTEHLSVEEVQRLFTKVRELVTAGTGVVYISHRIPEVKQIADRITVLRDGQVRGTFDASDIDEHQIIELVVGRALDTVFPVKASVTGVVSDQLQLTATNLRGSHFHDINLSIIHLSNYYEYPRHLSTAFSNLRDIYLGRLGTFGMLCKGDDGPLECQFRNTILRLPINLKLCISFYFSILLVSLLTLVRSMKYCLCLLKI